MKIGPTHIRDRTSTDDESLMAKVRDQNCIDSFSELFERWKSRIHRMCFRMTGNWQDAEDATQEVFGKLFRARNRYRVEARFGTFLWSIAVNQTRDVARRKGREQAKREAVSRQMIQVTDPEAATEKVEIQDEVQHALLKLSEPLRQVVVLRHYEGLAFSEIAGLLDIPQGTVASRMARALRLLQRSLDPENRLHATRGNP